MIQIPTTPQHHDNLRRHSGDDLPCAVCGKPIKTPRHHLRVWNGCYAVTEAEVAAITEGTTDTGLTSNGDTGLYPIGRDCLKRHPELAPYLVPDTPPDAPVIVEDDDTPSFEDAIADMTNAWREASTDTQILVRDDRGTLIPFVDEPLPGDSDTDAVMFLSDVEAEFMRTICLFDGLLVYPHQRAEILMTAKLEKGGLVKVQRAHGYVIVSAVRPTEGED